jgi:hypothetical protein
MYVCISYTETEYTQKIKFVGADESARGSDTPSLLAVKNDQLLNAHVHVYFDYTSIMQLHSNRRCAKLFVKKETNGDK